MKLLLDECLPRKLKRGLPGHDTYSPARSSKRPLSRLPDAPAKAPSPTSKAPLHGPDMGGEWAGHG